MATHTPGPWTVFQPYDGDFTFGIEDRSGTAVVWYGDNHSDGIPNLLDAQLIAAAPDMLDALQRVAQILGQRNQPGWEQAMLETVNAAIAKATGE